jgi:hypothetical protein
MLVQSPRYSFLGAGAGSVLWAAAQGIARRPFGHGSGPLPGERWPPICSQTSRRVASWPADFGCSCIGGSRQACESDRWPVVFLPVGRRSPSRPKNLTQPPFLSFSPTSSSLHLVSSSPLLPLLFHCFLSASRASLSLLQGSRPHSLAICFSSYYYGPYPFDPSTSINPTFRDDQPTAA